MAPKRAAAVTVEDASSSDDEDKQPKASTSKGKQADVESVNEDEKNSLADEKETIDGKEKEDPQTEQHDWQAIWAPMQGAYYFFNSKTNETTWINPLAPPSASPPPAATEATEGGESPPWDPSSTTLPDSFSSAPGDTEYDPALMHLLGPSTASSSAGGSAYQAAFNKRTGRFESDPSRNPDHLSDWSRMKRQNDVFFDSSQWQAEREAAAAAAAVEADNERAGKKARLSKKDVKTFKERREAKKMMKNAWLRN